MKQYMTAILILAFFLANNTYTQQAAQQASVTPTQTDPLLIDVAPSSPARGKSQLKVRIKDVTRFKGSEKYTLVGYGLVTGLNGTGDSDTNLTQSTIQNLLHNFNIVIERNKIKAQNSAAVTVTATIEHSAHKGDMITANVAAIGDSTDLRGGQLLLTPLLGTDAEVWAIAQGPVVTGGFSFGSSDEGGEQVTKNFPTVGMLTGGVKLLRDINIEAPNKDIVTLYMKDPDFTSAVNLTDVINKAFLGSAMAIDASTIKIRVPKEFREENRVPEFISNIEQMEFHTDEVAKVVFNERTGTIVIGENVKVSKVAICHGNITVNIKRTMGVSQPNAFSYRGSTEVINDEKTDVIEDVADIKVIEDTTTVGELAQVLNDLGVSSRDIMVIFHVLKEAGALHAELEAM